jgi:hypothetical protein
VTSARVETQDKLSRPSFDSKHLFVEKKGKTMNIGRSLSLIFSFVAIAALGGAAAGSALSARQDQDKKAPASNQSIAGEWSATITEFGREKQTLGPIQIKLKAEGDKLTGVFVTPRMGDVPLENLKFDGEALLFKVSNGEQHFEFDLKLSDGKFEGKMIASVSKMVGKATMTRKE